MIFFVKVYFWMALICLVINILMIAFSELPKTRTETLGFYVAKVLLSMPFVIWAGILLWM